MTQSIPVPEPPIMEAANPRTWDQQPSSSSGAGSRIRTYEALSPTREESIEQLVKTSKIITKENLLELAEGLGIKITKKICGLVMRRYCKVNR
jgi:hypothetical protein